MSWNDVGSNVKQNNNNEGKKTVYVTLPVGSTKLRIVDEEPESRWTHWIPQANGGKGLSVRCIGKGCPVCTAIKADKAANRKTKYSSTKSHAINVIDRADGEVKVLDKGNSIFNQLLVLMGQMGDLRNYDVTITRTGESFGSISYMVTPVFPPSELTEEEKAKVEANRFDLKEITKAFTAEQIVQLMSGATLDEVVKNDEEVVDEPVDFTR